LLKKRTYDQQNGELQKAIENSGIEFREFAAMSLEKMNVKSKKKRIRQKALKKAFTQNEVAKEILLMVQLNKQEKKPDLKQGQAEESVTTTLSVQGLPVTFLLKLGKKYLKEEEVVRFYYTADKEPYYKNKQLLEETVELKSKELEPSLYASFQADVKVEFDKKARK
jgi:hypothetical protein